MKYQLTFHFLPQHSQVKSISYSLNWFTKSHWFAEAQTEPINASLILFINLSHSHILYFTQVILIGSFINFYFFWSSVHYHHFTPTSVDGLSLEFVSMAPVSILADVNSVVIWMVSTRILISNSSDSLTNPLVTVLNIPITICITVTFMFHSFFQQSPGTYLSFHHPSILLCGLTGGQIF